MEGGPLCYSGSLEGSVAIRSLGREAQDPTRSHRTPNRKEHYLMALTAERKREIVEQYGTDAGDTGSTPVQVTRS